MSIYREYLKNQVREILTNYARSIFFGWIILFRESLEKDVTIGDRWN